MRSLEDQGFLFILVAISLAFALVIWPYYEAVVWGVVTAVVFAPLYRRLRNALPRRRNLAALTTVLIIVAMVILPLMVIASSLLQEMLTLYDSFKLDELDFARYFQRVLGISPNWAVGLLDQFGLTNFTAVQERLAALERSAKPLPPAPSMSARGRSTSSSAWALCCTCCLFFCAMERCLPNGSSRRYRCALN